jgi:hypothetical protein
MERTAKHKVGQKVFIILRDKIHEVDILGIKTTEYVCAYSGELKFEVAYSYMGENRVTNEHQTFSTKQELIESL